MLLSKINKLFLACFITISSFSFTSSENSKIDQINWEKFEDIVIRPSLARACNPNNKAIRLFSSLGIGVSSWSWISYIWGAISLPRTKYISLPANPDIYTPIKKGFSYNKHGLLLTAIPSLFITKYAFRKMGEWILARQEQKALKAFIENWEVNQKFIPIKLYDLLENTYLKYKEDPKLVDFAETARIVKALFNHHQSKQAKKKN